MEELKKGKSYTYILKGEPEALVLRRSEDVVGWNSYKERKVIADITFDSQHDDRPVITSPILFEVDFYFPIPHGRNAKIKASTGDMHNIKPSLFLLLNFLENSASGVVYADGGQIARMTCRKHYDTEPRTVLIITELHEKRESSRKKAQE